MADDRVSESLASDKRVQRFAQTHGRATSAGPKAAQRSPRSTYQAALRYDHGDYSPYGPRGKKRGSKGRGKKRSGGRKGGR